MKISFLPLLTFMLATAANAQRDADTSSDSQDPIGSNPGSRVTDTLGAAAPNPR